MIFPDRPLCHEVSSVFTLGDHVAWREPNLTRQPAATPFRTCGYCGSIHPEDLLHALRNGASLHGSDWKYGWPHKFYVEGIPNPLAGRTVQIGTDSHPVFGCPVCRVTSVHERQPACACGAPLIVVKYVSEPIMGAAPVHAFAKFYSEHLRDLTDPETFDAVADAVAASSKIRFTLFDGTLRYRAPSQGFQA